MATLDERYREAAALHQRGQLAAAERLYDKVLRQRPDHFDALHLSGLIALQTGRPERGAALIARAVRVNPRVAEAHANLGFGLRALRRFEDAVASYDRALSLRPDYAEAWFNRGNALLDLGRAADALASFDQAIAHRPNFAEAHANAGNVLRDMGRNQDALARYDKAIALNPGFFEAHDNRGLALRNLSRFADAAAAHGKAIAIRADFAPAHNNRGVALCGLDRDQEAVACFDKAIALRPDYAEAFSNRGIALAALRRFQDALDSYDRAIALRPDYAEAHGNRGFALRGLERFADAVASLDKAIALKPDYADAYGNRGIALADLRRFQDALADQDRALALKPDYPEALNNRGVALAALGRYQEALACYDQVFALDPAHAGAHNNRAIALGDLRRHDDAIASYEAAIRLNPDYVEGYCNLGLYELRLGRFDRGWRLNERRRDIEGHASHRALSQPSWVGEQPIAGKTLFIHWEQGLGDTIQFCRYAKLLTEAGARVVMEVQKPLVGLMRRLDPAVRIVAPGEDPGPFDFHAPLMSLPMAFGTTLETIPAERCYLSADETRSAEWRTRLPAASGTRVGLVWSGNPDHRNDHNRSIGLTSFLPLAGPGIELVCLQKELREPDAELLARDGRIAFHGGQLADFGDTAALVDQMDLVITIDTSVAHLAAAMGKPVWLLLPFNPDWRWMLDREDTPWYPSVRLFRQDRFGDWDSVVARVARALSTWTRPIPSGRS